MEGPVAPNPANPGNNANAKQNNDNSDLEIMTITPLLVPTHLLLNNWLQTNLLLIKLPQISLPLQILMVPPHLLSLFQTHCNLFHINLPLR